MPDVISSLEGNVFYYLLYVSDRILIHSLGSKKISCYLRAQTFIAIVKFIIGNIVKQRAQFNNKLIGTFILGDEQGIVIHPLDMKPVMTPFSPLQSFFYKSFGVFYDQRIAH